MGKSARLITEQQKKSGNNEKSSRVSANKLPLLRMQPNAANQAAHAPAIQAKLSVTPPGDVYEQEADRIAASIVQQERQTGVMQGNGAAVMRQDMPEEEEELQMKRSSDMVQRQEEEEELAQPKLSPGAILRQEEEEELIQAKSNRDTVPQVDGNLESRINSEHGGGHSLPPSVSTSFESQMGHNLSQVRVHTGTEANALSRSLQAEAFTTGSDIFFRAGRYNPGNETGRELLAHEVTHVVQQGAAPALRKEEQ